MATCRSRAEQPKVSEDLLQLVLSAGSPRCWPTWTFSSTVMSSHTPANWKVRPRPRAARWWGAVDDVVVEDHGAVVAREPAQGVDGRRLPGAVRTDQADDLTLVDPEAHLVDRHDAAVADQELVHLEEWRRRPACRRHHRGMPVGRRPGGADPGRSGGRDRTPAPRWRHHARIGDRSGRVRHRHYQDLPVGRGVDMADAPLLEQQMDRAHDSFGVEDDREDDADPATTPYQLLTPL